MACLASLLPSSSFFLVYSSSLLDYLLPWSVFQIFLVWVCVYSREREREKNERKLAWQSCFSKDFAFSLSCSLLAEHFRLGGGRILCFIFFSFSCLVPFFKIALNANHFLSWWYSKNHAPTMVFLEWFGQLASKSQKLWLNFSLQKPSLAGQAKWEWAPLGSFLTTQLKLSQIATKLGQFSQLIS